MDAAERVGREAERGGCAAVEVVSMDRFDAVSVYTFFFALSWRFDYSRVKTGARFRLGVFAEGACCSFRGVDDGARGSTGFHEGKLRKLVF